MIKRRKTTGALCLLAAGLALAGCAGGDRTEWIDDPSPRLGRASYPLRHAERSLMRQRVAARPAMVRPAQSVRPVDARPSRRPMMPASPPASGSARDDSHVPNPAGGGDGGGGGGGGAGWSDIRLKRNIERVGTSPGGHALYAFDYVWGGPRQVGVMAQEVMASRPDAVIRTASGYLMVDYSRLGLGMTTYAAWRRSASLPQAAAD
ncbi:tail fiber domain-containing protein [Phreatobacter sp. AB_2022a]|uniref:tail fiber domain-containing protein n=1 Tax=Phreatobacter sp. AB_2022a TaxID=3003134 RepID=UPI00228716A8|nr:tail fiber domain-containing protein [Phreatobacter sp. AB_2022a]MCZ0738339.1 tail fiber domain-containing protein [Phreatobacter sp. AB_2022a]